MEPKDDVLNVLSLATPFSLENASGSIPLDADPMVKGLVGTLLGGRSKDSIIDIRRI